MNHNFKHSIARCNYCTQQQPVFKCAVTQMYFEWTEMNIIVSLLTFENIQNSLTQINDSLMNNGINAVPILCSFFNSTELFGGKVVSMQWNSLLISTQHKMFSFMQPHSADAIRCCFLFFIFDQLMMVMPHDLACFYSIICVQYVFALFQNNFIDSLNILIFSFIS